MKINLNMVWHEFGDTMINQQILIVMAIEASLKVMPQDWTTSHMKLIRQLVHRLLTLQRSHAHGVFFCQASRSLTTKGSWSFGHKDVSKGCSCRLHHGRQTDPQRHPDVPNQHAERRRAILDFEVILQFRSRLISLFL